VTDSRVVANTTTLSQPASSGRAAADVVMR
jgi:hypothetical protein